MRNLFMLCCLLAALVYACQTDATRTSPQGHEYTVHVDAGNEKAQTGDYIYFELDSRTTPDSVIFSTREGGQRPLIQALADTVTQKLDPVTDIVRLLGVGDSVTISVPLDSFESVPPVYQDAEFIYYDVVVTEIMSQEDFEAMRAQEQEEMRQRMQEAIARAPEVMAFAEGIREQYVAGTLENVQTTASGLKYIIHEAGTGAAPQTGQNIQVQYIGMLTDGTVFDQSFERGRSIEFPIGAGSVIPGWDEGLSLLKEGAKATLFIPSELGYGAAGSPPVIPENAELVFYVELEKVGTES